MSLPTTECRSLLCKARIVYALTVNGRRMPVDLEPHPNGNVLLVTAPGWEEPRAFVLGRWTAHTVEEELSGRAAIVAGRKRWEVPPGFEVAPGLHMPHHATCPEAGRFR